jgi:hypothetical protein
MPLLDSERLGMLHGLLGLDRQFVEAESHGLSVVSGPR